MKNKKVKTIHIPYKRIFLISDIHFGVRANSLEWLRNQELFFKEFYIPFLRENVKDGDILFMLGDWFDNRQLLDILVMNVSIDIVIEMAKILPLHFITGNHDIYKKQETDVNSLRAFSGILNVTIYTDPVIVTNNNSTILVMPWVGDKKIEEELGKNNPADYIFAHTDLAGFKYDNNMKITHGAQLMNIKNAKRIISGHIHKRQEMENGRGIYVGSPYHTKRSDINNGKGVYVFTPDDNHIEFYENTLSSIFQRIRLEDLMEKTLEETYSILENNYTDIIVSDKYIHLFNLTRFIDLIKGCLYKSIETRGESIKLEDSLSGLMEGEEIKDILTLLEMTLDDTFHSLATISILKIKNEEYYKMALDEKELESL
jgi:UDP-2,3-diacylglucosamine pyrophosphatase LpxH